MARNAAVFAVPVVLALALLAESCVDPGWSFPAGYDSFTAVQGYDISGATAFLSVAAVSLQPDRNDKTANLTAMQSMVGRVMAEHPATDVIVFNELCTSWLTDPGSPSAYFTSLAGSSTTRRYAPSRTAASSPTVSEG